MDLGISNFYIVSKKYRRLLIYLLGLLALADIISHIGDTLGYSDFALTPLSLLSKYLVLFILIYIAKKSNWTSDIPQIISFLLKAFLVCNIVAIFRGAILATDYWDWKFLFFSSLLFFLIPLSFFLGKHLPFVRTIFKNILSYLFRFGFLLIPVSLAISRETYSRLMIPVSVFILLIPYLKPKWRLLILVVAVTSILVVIDFRTNIIKTAISLLILTTYYFRRYILSSWIKIVHTLIFALPLILLFLAVTGQYNIFRQTSENNSYTIKAQKGDLGDENLAADTRTFLYVEVFQSLLTNGDLVFGEGGTGKYKTDYFDYLGDHRGRYSSEVGFLNILLYSGIVGVIIYFLILYIASFYAVYKSNNFLCKMLGLLIAGRWLLFFIEEFTNFDLNTLFTWIVIGLICNREFRAMSDSDLKLFLKFD